MKKRLYKNKNNAKIFGVLGGISEYLDIDPTVVRVVYVLILLVTRIFVGVLVYFILAAIMPEKSEIGHDDYEVK